MLRCFLALLLFPAAPGSLSSQTPSRLSPVADLFLGTTRVPERLVETCGHGPGSVPAGAVRMGMARGPWAAQLEGSFYYFEAKSCVTLDPVFLGGTHTTRSYTSARRGHSDRTVALRARYEPEGARWSAGLGAGRLLRARVPYALASVGIHTRGRLRAALEVEPWAVRLSYDEVTAEWEDGQVVRELARDRRHEWASGFALRLGMEWRPR